MPNENISIEKFIVQQRLNIRKSAGYEADIIKVLPERTVLFIDKKKTVDNEKWGHAPEGWVCLTYCEKITTE